MARTIGDGLSTAPDVKKIRETFPDSKLIEGETKIEKESIAKILYLDIESCRYKTVTRAWRNAVQRESGKLIRLVDGFFCVLDDSGKLEVVKSDLAGAGRKIRKARTNGSLIERKNLSDEERCHFDRVNFRMSKMMEADRLASKAEIPQLIGSQS
jgi:hypothetical protein